MAELLFGIVIEEIPARMQIHGMTQFKALVERLFREANLSWSRIEVFVTPRRITLWVEGLPQNLPAVTQQRKGPRIDAPEEAQRGFFQSVGLTPAQCQTLETPKGTFWVADVTQGEIPTRQLLPALLQKALHTFHWPKAMRWAHSIQTWVRPIKRLLCLFDGEVLPVRFDPEGLDLVAGDQALANRFLGGDAFSVVNFADYDRQMRERFVILRRDERRSLIEGQLLSVASENQLELLPEDLAVGGLIDEVTGLLEWPFSFKGVLDDVFLTLPQELIVTPMRVHQRYFPLRNPHTKKLAPFFIVVAANNPSDGGNKMMRGYERVLRARLSDARFFWKEDLKKGIEAHREGLENRLFFEGLGTLWDKTERLATVVSHLFPHLPSLTVAARFSKADLSSQVVGEFPELQGVMGYYYSLEAGFDQEIAEAIRDHYLPQGSKDLEKVPSPLGRLLGLLDRIDTLYGFFSIGIHPTGSKDPFALRRAGNGFIELFLRETENLSLEPLLRQVDRAYRSQGHLRGASFEETLQALWVFFQERLTRMAEDQTGFFSTIPLCASDLFLVAGGADSLDPFDLKALLSRVLILREFLDGPEGKNVRIVTGRVLSFLKSALSEEGIPSGEPDPSLFVTEEESSLWERVKPLSGDVPLEVLANLRGLVDSFFEKVTVNSPDPSLRENRLKILEKVRLLFKQWGDFSYLEERR